MLSESGNPPLQWNRMSTGICGIILAAGESTRMGRDKALLPWPTDSTSSTLLSTTIRAFSDSCDFVLVVVGGNELALAPVVFGEGAFLVRNPQPERGQFSSMQTGLQEVLNRGRDIAMITLVDRPPPRPETLTQLVDAFSTRDHSTWAVIPEYQGKHGHPILVGRELIEALLRVPATSTARDILHANQPHILYVKVEDPFVTQNINTPQEYLDLQGER
jgi:molybdenum cofactor cytidylyltransferase